MPLTVSDGALVVHGDKLGTEQECCCPKCRCDLVCPEFAGAEVSVTGTRVGTVSTTIPNADPGFDLSVAPLCDVRPFGGGRQIIWGMEYVEDYLVVQVSFNVVCGWEFGLAPGEYFVSVVALVGTPPDDPSITRTVSYEKLYTDCDANGLPVIDTDNMVQLDCSDGSGNPLTPCPVRIQSRLLLA